MPRSTLAPNPRKATPHTSPTSRKNHEATAVATPMLLTRSPLSESFRPWGETLVLGLVWPPRPAIRPKDPDRDGKLDRLRVLLNKLPADKTAVFMDGVDV